MGLKRYKYLLIIVFVFIIVPDKIWAYNTDNPMGPRTYYLGKGTNYSDIESEFLHIFPSKYEDGHEFVPKPDNEYIDAGNYYLRYDITYIGINNYNKLTMQGWGIIKDYNNGIKGEYAPRYYLKISNVIDNGNNEISTIDYFYRYDADPTKDGISFPELNDAEGASDDFTPCGDFTGDGTATAKRNYKNAEFSFNEIDLNQIINEHKALGSGKDMNLEFYMMIVVDSGPSNNKACSKTRTGWFKLGMYNVDNGNNGIKKVDVTNNNFTVSTTDEVDVIASNTAYQLNETYKIDNIASFNDTSIHNRTAKGNGIYAKKYFYKLKNIDGTKLPSSINSYSYSTWVQFRGSLGLNIIYHENKSCSDPSYASANQADCCSNEIYAINNQRTCCSGNYISDEALRKRVCCEGSYGYEHAYKSAYKTDCCQSLPETCCGNENFVNNNWNYYSGSNSWISTYVCCNQNKSIFGGFEFDSFKTAGLNSLFASKCTAGSSNPPKKVCASGNNKTSSTTKSISFNGISAIDSFELDITLPSDADPNSVVNENNLAYEFSSFSGPEIITDFSNFKITEYKIKNKNGNTITLSVSYSFKPGASQPVLTPGIYEIKIKFFICYDKLLTPPLTGCSDPIYYKNNKALCDPAAPFHSVPTINLTCNQKESTVYEEDYFNDDVSNIGNIRCKETVKFILNDENMSTPMLQNNIYAGTGFSYNINVEDTIKCYLSIKNDSFLNDEYSNYSTMKSEVETKIKNALNEKLNYDSSSSYNDKIIFTSNGSNVNYKISSSLNLSSSSQNGTLNFKTKIWGSKWINHRYVTGLYNEDVTGDFPVSMSKTAKYTVQLENQYINRLTGNISTNKSGNVEYIDGKNKFYTDIDADTGFYDIKINLSNFGLTQNHKIDRDNVFTCQYPIKNILTTGGNISSSGVEPNNGNNNYIIRPISLTDPFSNKALFGSERATNWIRADNSLENNYIKNTQEEITINPLYEFNLTAYDISKIKGYNTSHQYNTWNFDTNDFTVQKSVDSTGNEIDDASTRTSKFISCILTGNNCDDYVDTKNDGIFNNSRGIGRDDKIGEWQ